jgi:PAS domain S-box-containing protein
VKKTEKQPQKTQLEWEEIFQAIGHATFILTPEHGVVAANQAAIRATGYSSEELIGKQCHEIMHGVNHPPPCCPLVKMCTSGNFETAEMEVETIGSTFLVSCTPVLDDDNNLEKVIHIATDITDRKQAERATQKASRIYAFISQINQMIVRTKDQKEIFKQACKIAIEYGKFRMAWIGLIDAETKQVMPHVWKGFENGYLTKIKKISVKNIPEGRGPTGSAIRQGKYFVCNDIKNDPIMKPWRDEALERGYRSSVALPILVFGKVVGAFNLYASDPHFFNLEEINLLNEVVDDIAFALESIKHEEQRKQAEEALLESEKRYELASQAGLVGVWDWNLKTNDIYIDPNLKAILGYKNDEIKNHLDDWGKHVHPDDTKNVMEKANAHLKGEAPIYEVEHRMLHKDGSIRWFLTRGTAYRKKDGKAYRVVGTDTDITERKQSEQKINNQLEELQRWQEVTMNREDRVMELKADINELLKKLGQPMRYKSQQKSSDKSK